MMPKVTPAVAGVASEDASVLAGTRLSMSKQIGNTATAISITTVPPTVGVIMRRKSDKRAENKNWANEDATTRVASNGSPLLVTAMVETAIKAPDVPMNSTYPAPNGPIGRACNTVVSPLTNKAANTAQVINSADCPAAFNTITGTKTIPVRIKTTI